MIPINHRNAIWKIICRLTAIILMISLLWWAFDFRIVTTTYRISDPKIDGSIRIVFISDLHSCRHGVGQDKLVEAIEREEPDVILYGGDIVDDKLPQDPAIELLAAMEGKYPAFGVTGNHEFQSGRIGEIKGYFQQYQVELLEGEGELLRVRDSVIQVCGIDDVGCDCHPQGVTLEQQLKDIEAIRHNDIYSILLAHRPENIEEFVPFGFDLVLAGHAHGGQWRIPWILTGLYSPGQGFFPAYTSGIYNVNQTPLLVSRGLVKASMFVPRIFNRPELVIIELTGNQAGIGN